MAVHVFEYKREISEIAGVVEWFTILLFISFTEWGRNVILQI